MSDKTYDVVIAGYVDIDTAKKDFDALTKLVEDMKIKTTEGVILVEHDNDGAVHVTDAADHHGRKGLEWGGGAGLVVGLFAPPLLATVVVGAAAGGVIGKFTKHRVDTGIEKNVGEAIPKGFAGIITLVEVADTAAVKGRTCRCGEDRSRRSRRRRHQSAQGRSHGSGKGTEVSR